MVRLCDVCSGGNGSSATNCYRCHGIGFFLQTGDDVWTWDISIDRSFFERRRVRRIFHRWIQVILGILIVGGIGQWIFALIMALDPSAGFSVGMVSSFAPLLFTSWHWTGLWLSGLLGCFLIFHLRVYHDRAELLPYWLMGEYDDRRAPAIYQTSRYIQEAAWDMVEASYELARELEHGFVYPIHVFASALTSSMGGIFFTRLGLDFERIREHLSALLARVPHGSTPQFSLETYRIFLQALELTLQSHRKHIGSVELFLAAFASDEALQGMFDAAGVPSAQVMAVAEWIRLQEHLKEEHDRFVLLARQKPNTSMNRTMTAIQTSRLDEYSEDVTLLARNGYVMPLIGREREMEEVLRVFESGKGSLVLVGEAGVGKSALIEGLARRMVEEKVPSTLFDQRLVSIHLAHVIASGGRADAAERLLSILQEAEMSGNVVLVIEGLEALVGIGSGGPMDLAEILASELEKGSVQMIATTTPSAWTTYLERRSIGSGFTKVMVHELASFDAIRVLMAKAGYIEYKHRVFFTYGALQKAVEFSSRYLEGLRLPANALELLKEAAVAVAHTKGDRGFVEVDDIAKLVHEKTSIPVEALSQDEADRLLQLEAHLHGRIVGQDEAVTAVAQAMRRARAEVREARRPIASFLFLGPTGVGKTELAKVLADEYFGSEHAMIRVDMSEYQDPASVARMIGVPGDPRGGLLTEAVRKQPFTIVLLDELEKAHPDILTLFLQVMDDGRLTDGIGRTVSFVNTVLIATSNAATSFIQQEVSNGASIESIKTALLERELRDTFRPEFLNRFDGVIVFKPLTQDDVEQIAWLLINSLAKRLEQEKGIVLHAEDEAVRLLARAGYDPLFGARPLKRVIQDRVENALADLLLKKAVKRRDTLLLKEDGTLEVRAFDL